MTDPLQPELKESCSPFVDGTGMPEFRVDLKAGAEFPNLTLSRSWIADGSVQIHLEGTTTIDAASLIHAILTLVPDALDPDVRIRFRSR